MTSIDVSAAAFDADPRVKPKFGQAFRIGFAALIAALAALSLYFDWPFNSSFTVPGSQACVRRDRRLSAVYADSRRGCYLLRHRHSVPACGPLGVASGVILVAAVQPGFRGIVGGAWLSAASPARLHLEGRQCRRHRTCLRRGDCLECAVLAMSTPKIASLPMMFIVLGVFVGGTLWTVAYSDDGRANLSACSTLCRADAVHRLFIRRVWWIA